MTARAPIHKADRRRGAVVSCRRLQNAITGDLTLAKRLHHAIEAFAFSRSKTSRSFVIIALGSKPRRTSQ